MARRTIFSHGQSIGFPLCGALGSCSLQIQVYNTPYNFQLADSRHIQCASGGWRFLRIFNKPPHCSTNCDAIPPAEDQALCSVSKIFMRTLSFSPPSAEFAWGEMHRWDQKITGENWFWSQCGASSPRQKMTRSALVFISIHCIQAGCGLLSSGGCGPTLHSTPTVPIIAGYSTWPLIPVTTRLRSLQVAANKTLSL